MGRALLRTQLWCGMADEEVRDRPMKHPKSKLDKAIDDWQEILYSVLVEYQKEDTNETNTTNNPKR